MCRLNSNVSQTAVQDHVHPYNHLADGASQACQSHESAARDPTYPPPVHPPGLMMKNFEMPAWVDSGIDGNRCCPKQNLLVVYENTGAGRIDRGNV